MSLEDKVSKKIIGIYSPRYGGCKLRVFLVQEMGPRFFYSSNNYVNWLSCVLQSRGCCSWLCLASEMPN